MEPLTVVLELPYRNEDGTRVGHEVAVWVRTKLREFFGGWSEGRGGTSEGRPGSEDYYFEFPAESASDPRLREIVAGAENMLSQAVDYKVGAQAYEGAGALSEPRPLEWFPNPVMM